MFLHLIGRERPIVRMARMAMLAVIAMVCAEQAVAEQVTVGALHTVALDITARAVTAVTPDSTADSSARRPTVLAPTVVTAARESERRTDAAATIDVVTGKAIRQTQPMHPANIMNRVAGVHITQLTAEGHSTAIRQPLTTKAMYLYLEDGIPTRATGFFNHNALYEVNIPQAGGIEVFKGPGTALYGSDAIGGIVNVLTRPAPARPTVEASLEGGAFGYTRGLFSTGFRTPSTGLRADLNLTRSDGQNDNAPYNRQSGTIRWDYANAEGWTTKTVGTMTSVDQHDIPTLPTALYDARSTVNLAPIAFRTVRAARLSTAIEHDDGTTLWSFTPYARHDVLDILPSWQLSYDPQVWDTENNSAGLLAKFRRTIDPINGRVIAGVDVDYSPGRQLVQQALVTKTGTPVHYTAYTLGATQYNYDVTYHSVSPYVQFEMAPIEWLHFDAGVRYDMVGYNYDTKLAPVDTGSHRVPASTNISYRHVSPKIGVTFDVTPSVNVFASYRHGFRAPQQSQLFEQNTAANTVGLRPVSANSYETGVRGSAGTWLGYSVSAYDMFISDDIITYITAQNTREAVNAGHTRHRGIETSVSAELPADLRLDVAYSVSSQRYITWVPQAGVSYSGNKIEQAPKSLGNVLAAYTPKQLHGGQASLEWVLVGPYELDPQNQHSYNGYRLVNAYLSYKLSSTTELFAKALNLTNRNYSEVVSYDQFQLQQYQPGSPRALYGGVRLVMSH